MYVDASKNTPSYTHVVHTWHEESHPHFLTWQRKSWRILLCSLHIEGDGQSKLKGHGFWSPENGTNCTQVCLLVIGNKSTCVGVYGLGDNLLPIRTLLQFDNEL